MSSSRSSRQTPFFVSSRARKKGRSIEEPTPTPEAYIYSSPEPRLNVLEASMDEIKEEQKRLGKTMEDMVTSMKTGFDNIKHLLTAYTEHFGTLDKDMRALKHQVNNSIHVASNVIQDTVNEFKATSAELQTFVQKSAEDVVLAIEVQMDSDRNLHSHVLKWTYWFSTTWMEWLKKFEIEYPPPPIKKSKHSSSSSQPPPT
ncbi:hypothetical protein CJ030_MR6G018871 [Morella rubra]|uniref:Uncharacterized protein n=1 Tax=Morella rubra TaxID=262757 RepID=A0A6A1VEM5_9ROSI|nr:hypothetical protein CJ030_MR6G018871 [Morella rubra]